MKNIKKTTFALLFLSMLSSFSAWSCSMCKITTEGKTFVGNNEDMWSNKARIWFEVGETPQLGVAYLGHERRSPQGGINEAGLVFDALTLHPKKELQPTGTKAPESLDILLRQIMQTCKNAREVQQFLKDYNLSLLNRGMLWFIDAKGEYLIVEADTLIFGNEDRYVLTNYRVSETANPAATVKYPRHHKGLRQMENTTTGSVASCTAIMNSMSVCREGLGDGTLYTNVFDLENKTIYLNFYHDFNHTVSFELAEELSKGSHEYTMVDLFPENPDYIRSIQYVTPFNSPAISLTLKISMGILFLNAVYFFFLWIFKLLGKYKDTTTSQLVTYWAIPLIVANALLFILIVLLLLLKAVCYFGIESSLGEFPFTQIIYAPLLLGILSIPFVINTIHIFRKTDSLKFTSVVYAINTAVIVINVGLQAYWGLIFP